jgi:DNA uptake protein ComE-like DNA-binding protein
MMTIKVRVNLANPLELLELPGVGPEQADAILRFRAQHGPIRDAAQLAGILGSGPTPETLSEQADFSPSEATAPEAPGA